MSIKTPAASAFLIVFTTNYRTIAYEKVVRVAKSCRPVEENGLEKLVTEYFALNESIYGIVASDRTLRVVGRVLVCRRRKHGHLAGYWEFPGGKCESRESPLAALHREIAEEVGIDVEAIHALAALEHEYPEVPLRIHAYVCRHVSGDAQAHASEELAWVEPQKLRSIQFPEANAPLLEQFERWLARQESVA